MLRNRFFNHIHPSAVTMVTKEADLFGAGDSVQDFIDNATPSEIGVFTKNVAGFWESVATNITNLNQDILITQHGGLDKEGNVILRKYQFKANEINVVKKGSVAPVKQISIASGFNFYADKDVVYQIKIMDLTKLTQKEHRYTFEVRLSRAQYTTLANDGARRTFVLDAFVAQINNPKHPMWHNFGQLYVASKTVGNVGLVITTKYFDETFQLLATETVDEEMPLVVTEVGAVDGTTAVRFTKGEGQAEEIAYLEKDGHAKNGYQNQNLTTGWFDYYEKPVLFAEDNCTYTVYNIVNKRSYEPNASSPSAQGLHKMHLIFAVKEGVAGTPETTFDTVFQTIGVKTY